MRISTTCRAVVAVLAPLAEMIPHAVLAGILVKVGYDIIDFSYLKRAHQGPRWDLALMVLVLSLTVFVDLITAVAAGVVLASLAFVKQMADAQLKNFGGQLPSIPSGLSDEEAGLLEGMKDRVTLFDFGGPLSFGAAADVGHHVRERVKNHAQSIVLDFSRVPFVDVSAARAVETIGCDARHAGKRVFVSGMNDEVAKILAGLNFYGNDFVVPTGGGPIVGPQYVTLLKKHKPDIAWNGAVAEHVVSYTLPSGERHVVYYPTLKARRRAAPGRRPFRRSGSDRPGPTTRPRAPDRGRRPAAPRPSPRRRRRGPGRHRPCRPRGPAGPSWPGRPTPCRRSDRGEGRRPPAPAPRWARP